MMNNISQEWINNNDTKLFAVSLAVKEDKSFSEAFEIDNRIYSAVYITINNKFYILNIHNGITKLGYDEFIRICHRKNFNPLPTITDQLFINKNKHNVEYFIDKAKKYCEEYKDFNPIGLKLIPIFETYIESEAQVLLP